MSLFIYTVSFLLCVLFQIISPDPDGDQEFGYAVSMSNEYIVVGAPGDDGKGDDSGAVFLYKTGSDNTDFTATFEISFAPTTSSANARFGSSVAVYDGDSDINIPEKILSEWVAVGAPGRSTTGLVSVYVKGEDIDSEWTMLADLTPPETVSATGFGQSVAWYNDFLVSKGG